MTANVNNIERPGLFSIKSDTSFFKRYRVAIHVTFWLALLLYEGLVWGLVDGEYGRRLAFSAVELPIKIAATYFTLYFLIDRFLIQRKYGIFLVGLIASMAIFGLLWRLVSYHTLYPIFYPNGTLVPVLYLPKILIGIFSIYSITAIVASFHIGKLWHLHLQRSQRLEKEKIESDLQLLKSQINPHFLFNTLNNLYVLTLNHHKSAPEVVHKLSELMSYLLYDSNQPEVSLDKELQYIDNYILLEKLRYESRLDVSLNIYDNVQGVSIAPLIILPPFVENCFKHGARHQHFNAWIRIDVSIQEHVVVFKIENSKSTEVNDNHKEKSGIGLSNVQKRLELIYPNRYDLQAMDESDSYLVILKIQLAETEYRQHALNQRNLYTLQNEMSGS
jgi:two-component system, LytTR family, sensor kinase